MREIDEPVQIGEGTEIIGENVKIGKFTRIGKNCYLKGTDITIGNHCFIGNEVKTDGGGAGNSSLYIGDKCLICDRVVLNNSSEIHIGNDSALGAETIVWTHGSFYPVLLGGAATFKPVKIGNYVWIPPRCQILSGVTIGDHVCVGTGSVISKNLPSGCLAWGVPAVILKENLYPKKLSTEQKEEIIDNIIRDYDPVMKRKGFYRKIERDGLIIRFGNSDASVEFDCENMKVTGQSDEYSEYFRDYLRRRGIRIFTDSFFSTSHS